MPENMPKATPEQNDAKSAQKRQDDFRELTSDEIESSTIFGKPQTKASKPPKKRGLGMVARTVIALFVVAAMIAATLLVNRYFGKSKGSSGSVSMSSAVTSSDPTVYATNYKSDEISSVKLKNQHGTYEFYSKKNTDAGDNDDALLWYIKGIDEKYINTESTALTVSDCASAAALMKQEYKDTTDYGFKNPTATAVVKPQKGESYTVTVGKVFKSSEISGAYMSVSTDQDHVYILSGEAAEYLNRERTYYISKVMPTAIEETKSNSEYFSDSLTGFDYVTVSGKAVEQTLRFELYGRENSTTHYILTKPYRYLVDSDKLETLMTLVREDLEATDVYYFNKDGVPESVLKSYDLLNPDYVVTYKVGNDTMVFKASQSKTDTQYYSVTVNDSKAIYKVGRGNFDFAEQPYTEFISENVVLENISGLRAMTVKMSGKTYRFELSTKTVKSTSSDSSETEETEETVVKYGGKTLDSDNFSNYYYYFLAITPYVSEQSLKTERPAGASEYFSVTYSHQKSVGDPDLTLTVFKLQDNDTRYYIELDGVPVGLCETKYADLAFDNISKVITDSKVPAVSS